MSATNPAVAALSAAGVSIWLDDLSRELMASGELARLVAEAGVVGVTTNPTIFATALAKGDRYTDQVRALAARGADVDQAVFEITTDDVRSACDLLRPVYEATDGRDGRVSIEVDPRQARDGAATIATARRLWATVDRPNAMIKIPATIEGLPAITTALAEGISVNVTLIFSLDRYRAVMNAWLNGLEGALQAGRDLSRIDSVASFFVSRVDTEIDHRLTALATPEALAARGEAALANARLAYQAFEEVTSTARWQTLAAEGARPQRPLWASTGVKEPSYPDTLYVSELVAPGTVNTMPGKTLDAVLDHGPLATEGGAAPDTVRGTYDEAAELLDRLAALGIDYAEVVDTLEHEGVDKFAKSWADLLATVSDELARAAALDEGESGQ
ncbi:MAG: transaldolase [Kineosporiaceae bacterium]|nr:transaldolase [Kineosporiaceae bacterium]MBK7624955.1 transaldolase [Kineosporiaceae bacterium]